MVDVENSKQQIVKLVEKFKNKDKQERKGIDEENTKSDFINEFFRILGWDMGNKKDRSEFCKEVQFEYPVRINGSSKAVDYCFKSGCKKKFFVEAKNQKSMLKITKKLPTNLKDILGMQICL